MILVCHQIDASIKSAIRSSRRGMSVREIHDWIQRHEPTPISEDVIKTHLRSLHGIREVHRVACENRGRAVFRWKISQTPPSAESTRDTP